MNRLQKNFQDKIKGELLKELELENVHQIPQIEKIVINSGVGRAVQDSKYIDQGVATITKISGQKPVVTKARHSIATYKLREGMPIGVSVTLRGERMWYFLDRLISIVIPRTRDFRGLSDKSFDKSGNYSIGFSDPGVFPELSGDDAAAINGMQLTIVTSTGAESARALLLKLGLPLEKGTK